MGQAIKSDMGTANDAVSKFWGVDTGNFKGDTLSIGASNISSIKKGANISKEMLTDLSKLSTCIKKQADKFTDLATVIQSRDTRDSKQFSGGK